MNNLEEKTILERQIINRKEKFSSDIPRVLQENIINKILDNVKFLLETNDPKTMDILSFNGKFKQYTMMVTTLYKGKVNNDDITTQLCEIGTQTRKIDRGNFKGIILELSLFYFGSEEHGLLSPQMILRVM